MSRLRDTIATVPADPDPEVMRVEAAIRALTAEQWERVRERLDLCCKCGAIEGGGGAATTRAATEPAPPSWPGASASCRPPTVGPRAPWA